MKNFLHSLFLLYGIYALISFLFFGIDGLLALLFILLSVCASVFLLTIKRKNTEHWHNDFTQKHLYISPLLKVLGIYFIYVIISIIASLLAVFVFDFDKQIVSNIDEKISYIVKTIWLLFTVGIIVKFIVDKVRNRK